EPKTSARRGKRLSAGPRGKRAHRSRGSVKNSVRKSKRRRKRSKKKSKRRRRCSKKNGKSELSKSKREWRASSEAPRSSRARFRLRGLLRRPTRFECPLPKKKSPPKSICATAAR